MHWLTNLEMYEGLELENKTIRRSLTLFSKNLQSYSIVETNIWNLRKYQFNKREQEANKSLNAHITALGVLAEPVTLEP